MAVVRARTPSSTRQCAYDVFLSFRGEDTRKTFTDHLYTALIQAGFCTFRDDDEIERGEYIESELQKGMEQSKIFVIVFSKTYAASKWCLDELLQIMHRKKAYRQKVLPIFYDVSPSEVRAQMGSFAEAFTLHEERCETTTDGGKQELMKKVESWRAALKDISNVAGMDLKNQCDGQEAKFIQKTVKVIEQTLNHRVLSITPYLIGMDDRVRNINSWLQDEAMDVSLLAICGMGGIGKTTIVKCVYNLNKRNFDCSSFLADIRERSKEPDGLVELQKRLLSDIGKEQKISCVGEGIIKILNAVSNKRILLVLDDVDQVDQLNEVFGIRQWFSPRSKIIITTMNLGLLEPHKNHKVHHVEHFNIKESLKLFSWHAFGQDHPNEDYLEHSNRVVHHCGGLPLALEVLGRSSRSWKGLNVWESALEKLRTIPNSKIFRKLEISYYSLEDDYDKDVFLHIACFFVGSDRDMTIKILDGCGLKATVGIQNLIDRCLLKVNMFNKLTMHQLLQDMGREIVRRESPKEPGKRSRLWCHKDSFDVLREKTGTVSIEGLNLDMHMFEGDKPVPAACSGNTKKRSYEEILERSFSSNLCSSLKRHFVNRFSWHMVGTSSRNINMSYFVETEAFAKMHNLKILRLNNVEITGCLNFFPKRLRWLCWHGFHSKFIPSGFLMESLVALHMHHSSLKQAWKGNKSLNSLKILDFSHSHELTETPDFSGLPNLEVLILEGCASLVEVHESIVKLEGLTVLNLKDCINLKNLPRNICMLKLEALLISGCSKLDCLPIRLGIASQLKVLHADGIDINQALSHIEEAQPWHAILWPWLSKPGKSIEISSISLQLCLVELSLAGCNLSDDSFPLEFGNLSLLERLDLSRTQIQSLPKSIRSLKRLWQLRVNSCKRLKSITGMICGFANGFLVVSSTYYGKISHRPSQPLSLHCADCSDLDEIEGIFKLEPMKEVDVEILKRWGFLKLEFVDKLMVNYHNAFGYSNPKNLPLQRLDQSGLHSYFLPGNKVPSEFRIKSTRSPLRFVVPSLVRRKIKGFVLCVVYTCENAKCHPRTLSALIRNRTKHVRRRIYPIFWGIPKPNEDMMWISDWTSGLWLEGGDKVKISVPDVVKPDVKVKEVGIQLMYELHEEMGTPTVVLYERSSHDFPLRREVIPTGKSTGNSEYWMDLMEGWCR